jgi:hypothetical protein
MVTLVAAHWKGGQHPVSLVQLQPDIRRNDWLERPAETVKAALRTWHAELEEEWVDLIALWQRCGEDRVSFADVCAQSATETERLAWGVEFLRHGHLLFLRHGSGFRPRPAQEVFAGQEGLAHHLTLVEAGAGAEVQVGERLGTLTGRSSWDAVEVRWEDGRITRVRTRTAHLVTTVAGESAPSGF